MGFFEKDKPGGIYESGDGLFGYKPGITHPLYMIGSALDGTLDMNAVMRMQQQRQSMAALESYAQKYGVSPMFADLMPIMGAENAAQLIAQQQLAQVQQQQQTQKNLEVAKVLMAKGHADLAQLAISNPDIAVAQFRIRETEKREDMTSMQPKLKEGYRWADASRSKMVPVEGAPDPVDQARRKKEAELAATSAADKEALAATMVPRYDEIIGLIDQITQNEAGLDAAVGFLDGRIKSFKEGTRTAEADLDELQSKVYMLARDQLKGQGPITEQEAAAAAASQINLDRTLPEKKIKENLKAYRAKLLKDRERLTGQKQQQPSVNDLIKKYLK